MIENEVEASLIAATLAPEEIQPGDFVAVLHEIVEFPPISCFGGWLEQGRQTAIRIRKCPTPTSKPMKVVSVCLPFVLVQCPDGKHRTLDVRLRVLARLSPQFGSAGFECFQKKEEPKTAPAEATATAGESGSDK